MILNGWQRLWIVLSFLGLFVIFGLNINEFPTKQKLKSEKISQIIEIDEHINNLKEKFQSIDEVEKPSKGVVRYNLYENPPEYKNLSKKQKEEFIKNRIITLEEEKKSIEKVLGNNLDQIKKHQIYFILRILIIWIALSLGGYLFFLCVFKLSLWVYSGFRHN